MIQLKRKIQTYFLKQKYFPNITLNPYIQQIQIKPVINDLDHSHMSPCLVATNGTLYQGLELAYLVDWWADTLSGLTGSRIDGEQR